MVTDVTMVTEHLSQVMLTNKSSESSKQLEKDVEYYKMLAKELKQKLRATQGQGLSGKP